MALDINLHRTINGTKDISNEIEFNTSQTRQGVLDYFNDNNIEFLVINHRSDINKKRILYKPGKIMNVGEPVNWMSVDWLITEVDSNNSIYYKGEMRKCNNTLTFQDEETLEIYTSPCILQDKSSKFDDGIKETKYIILADNQKLMIVPDNDITRKLYSKLGQKRYIFNNNKNDIYTITRVDDISQNGLLNVILKIDNSFNEDIDRLDLNIADYKESEIPVEPDPEPQEGYSITIEGEDYISMDKSENYTAKIYNNGVLVDDKSVIWTVSNTRLKITDSTGTTRTIHADVGDYSVGDYILTAALMDDENISTIKNIKVSW